MYLKKTSNLIERYRIVYPQYWLDKLTDDIMATRRKRGDDAPLVIGKVLAILRHPQLEREVIIPGAAVLRNMAFVLGLCHTVPKIVIPSLNLVTNDGDVYYAQMGCGEAVTNDFTAGGLRLGSGVTAVAKTQTDVITFLAGTGHTIDTGSSYPKTNDGDADNTGAGVDIMTWRISYTTAEGNASSIAEGAIVDNTTTPTVALTRFLFAAAFNKTSSDTLKVIVNHEVLGV